MMKGAARAGGTSPGYRPNGPWGHLHGLAAALALEGRITGSGPKDPALRPSLRATALAAALNHVGGGGRRAPILPPWTL